jgi:hypothetical protein
MRTDATFPTMIPVIAVRNGGGFVVEVIDSPSSVGKSK